MKKFFDRYVQIVIDNPWKIVVSIVVVSVVAAVWLAVFKPLRLDTNFTTLLPDSLPCVIESKRISKLVGSTDYLYVAIESQNPDDNIAFAEEIAAKLEKFPEIDWVATKEEKSYFRDRRLLYLDTEDLQEVVNRAEARVKYEKKIANPFYISLDDEQPPDISFDDVMDKYKKELDSHGAKGILESNADKKKKKVDMGDYIASADGTLVTVMARPAKPAVDMEFGRALVEKVRKLIDATNPSRNPSMQVEVAGSYRNRYIEYNNVVGDIFSSLAVSIGLILAIVVVFFRRVRSVALIFVPLIVAIILTVGLTALTLERLNMVTALIFAVLLGLGIDFGVHMTTRYLDERGRGKTLNESLTLALHNTGRAILTAGLTTAGGLAVLVLARFKGFSEFGIIATMGIVLCLLIYLMLMPAMAVLMEKVSIPKPWRKKTVNFSAEQHTVRVAPGKMGLLLGVLAAITAVAVYFATGVGFEYNFRNLGSRKKVSTNIQYGKTLSQSSSPVVAVLPTREDARQFTRHLEEIIEADVNDTDMLKNAFSVFSFVPDDQETKLALLKELQGHVDEALNLKKLKSKTKERLEEIRVWTDATEISVETLPSWVQGKFKEKDGTIGRMVYLFPRVSEYSIDRMSKFYDQYGVVEIEGKGQIRPSASGFILVEVVRAVQKDGLLMTIVATSVVLLLLLLDLRSFKRAVLVFVPLLLGLVWTAGLMGFFDIKIGLYNMLVLPTLLGIGIDASVHFYHSYKEFGPGSLWYVMKTTGVAIFIAAATTGVGFVGMMIVTHKGLQSIGNLAVMGIATCLFGALATLPVLLGFIESLKSKTASESKMSKTVYEDNN